ncbi:reductive dehalogenase [Dehalogenimonas formicexedens]|uniref:Reductive dehalogenase n=1 Tax=Dehalogenimonas formicexedens TaxID=1839801 RepID=A0A1P8F9Q4_9CHLR|nr:reductive dehalogenase [Dehalogenimonas formicexedens]APV45196.1 reductive dehalogenase [Dehalogenimonas formicexedens]
MFYHSTVSRRDFMKGIGLTSAGIGVASATAPIFHDLDESMDGSSNFKKPWWVREVAQPTAEVDWNSMTYFDSRQTMFNNDAFIKVIGLAKLQEIAKINEDNTKKWIQENKPGATLRDVALNNATGFGFAYGLEGHFVAPEIAPSPDQLGAARWEGTPEENLRMLRVAARFFGAKDIGVFELDQNTRKTVYSYESDGKAYTFENVPTAYETDTKRVIPEKTKYVVMFTILESEEMLKRAPDNINSATTTLAYNQGALTGNRLQQFLRGIGYQGLAEMMSNAIVQVAGGNVLSGLTEMGRMGITSLNPDYGPMMRTYKIITDLPLQPTSPIDAGMFRFCKTCMLCGHSCPSNAISLETEPSYKTLGPWNKPGIKNYYYDGAKCLVYWFEGVFGCGTCRAACPFGQKSKASIHDWIVKPVAAYTPVFNSFFTNMDTAFGYEPRDPDGFSPREKLHSWWDIENAPVYGIDTTRYTLKLQ